MMSFEGCPEIFMILRYLHNGERVSIMSAKSTSDSSEEARSERRSEMARALARGGMDGVHILTLKQAEKVLSPKRQEIVETLGQDKYESVRALARDLGRDKGQVSRELGLLAEHGIVTFETDGRSKSPRLAQEHVIIEPIV